MSAERHRIEVSYKPKHGKPSVFIVLLHGLDGDHTTFVNIETGVSMQQLLSRDIPSATILTYVYPNSFMKYIFTAPKGEISTKPSDTIKQRAKKFLKLLFNYVSSNQSQIRQMMDVDHDEDERKEEKTSHPEITDYDNNKLLELFLQNELFKEESIKPWIEYIYNYLKINQIDGRRLSNMQRDKFGDAVVKAYNNIEIKSAALITYDIFMSIGSRDKDNDDEGKVNLVNPMYEQLCNFGFDRNLSIKASEKYPEDLNAAISYIEDEQKRQEREEKKDDVQINLDDVPIIFIGHSMGGLVMKSALQIASNKYLDPQNHSIFKRTMGCIFYASPHGGSAIADYSSYLGPAKNSFLENNVQNLRTDDEYLKNLREDFVQIMKNHPVCNRNNICSFVESKKEYDTYLMPHVVQTLSGICGSETETLRELPYAHMAICKPTGFKDDRYCHLANFLRDNLKIKLIGFQDDHDIGIPSHFGMLSDENQLQSYLKYFHPNYALDIIAKIIYNDNLDKIYKGLVEGLSEVKVIRGKLDSMLDRDDLFDANDKKKAEILRLIIENKEMCDKVDESLDKMYKKKWEDIIKLITNIGKFDDYITNDSESGLLQIIVELRTFCTNKENNSHPLELYSLKIIQEIKVKFGEICEKCKELERHKNKGKGYGDVAKRIGIYGAIGVFGAGVGAVIAPVAVPGAVAGAVLGVIGVAGASAYHDKSAEKVEKDGIKFEEKCIRKIMNEDNFTFWYKNLCKYLKELKDLDKTERSKQGNMTYDSMMRLQKNAQKRHDFLSKLCLDV